MDPEDDDRLRDEIAERLRAGLQTEAWPRADSSEAVNRIVGRLGATDDLSTKLVVAGFTDHLIEEDEVEQACASCMYYLVHRRFCELPELSLPVEPHWSCRLWRI